MNTKVTRWSAIQRPDPNCHRRLNRDHIPPKSFSAPSVRSTHNLSMLLAAKVHKLGGTNSIGVGATKTSAEN
jgi:hypothetical protein